MKIENILKVRREKKTFGKEKYLNTYTYWLLLFCLYISYTCYIIQIISINYKNYYIKVYNADI